MTPEDLSGLRQDLSAIRNRLEELRDAIQEHSKAIHAAQEAQQQAQKSRNPTPIVVSYDDQTVRDTKDENDRQYRAQNSIKNWTKAAVIAASIYAGIAAFTYWEIRKATIAAKDSADAAKSAAYAACVSAQISQRELLEAQKTNSFSQTMANASTMQAAAEIDTEKSYITLNARLPKSEELIGNDPNFYIVYSLKNDGKSAANTVHITAKAILVTNDEVLKINDGKPSVEFQAGYLPAGDSFPETPEIGRPITPLMEVDDSKGSIVAKDSEEVQKVYHDSAIIAVIGHISYSDFAGTHKARFCASFWQMQAGTTRKGGSRPNERICANYNQKQDHYAFAAEPPPATSQTLLPNITCTAPK